jgi:hypothetical protein
MTIKSINDLFIVGTYFFWQSCVISDWEEAETTW